MANGSRVTGFAALPIVGRVFIIFGIVGMIASGVLAIVEMYGPRTASATGRIVAAEYNPRIEFSTADGTVIRFNNAVHSSFWGDGDSVPVAYDPTNPQNASVDSFAGRWFLAGLAGMLGGFSLLTGTGLAVIGRVLIRRIGMNPSP
ncbi:MULTISPECIES: DUF3592 domain-containing protein [unclassified Mesorhizobium]|uniref:DUF3592 domain-containing protein n=1 Tax=unclassified Mesorhizobium TaxID=325217 RepID=UPI00041121B3|nr:MULTISPECIES: DUF3592 domain-containing protein [unclassified Mesorhizobium]WJI78936.1 DUF3592 domain-containing protein [Mesorhizobium sp. C374B]WJI85470.1 DUF3592 domain-containing protein [Mesorhizobium sp. C372A]